MKDRSPQSEYIYSAPARPQGAARRRRRRSGLEAVLMLVFLLLGLGGAALFSYQYYLRDRVVPGVRVLGEDLGGMTRAEAETRLRERSGDKTQLSAAPTEPIVLRDGAHVFVASPAELGLRRDLQPSLDVAMSIGHSGDLLRDLKEQLRAFQNGADISTQSQFDEATAHAYVQALATQIDRPARDGGLRLVGLQTVQVSPQKGRKLDVEETVTRVRERLLDTNSGDIQVAVQESDPALADTSAARTQIENFLRAPVILTFGDREWAIDQATLAAMISIQSVSNADNSIRLVPALSHDALTAKVKVLAREINQTPRDARLHFNNGNVTAIVTSQEGRTLDVDATVKQIEQKFAAAATAQSRVNGNASPRVLTPIEALRENSVALSVQLNKPAVDMRDISKMGIKELVSQGVSQFKHSIPGRIQNIKTATAQFDGIVVPPGAVFSFDKYLNEVVEANGYEDAYVIFGNKTVLGPGGGVCQVSSTAFRAAFFGAFPIVERWAHAYRVSYYEPPVGLDATVFAPDVDFKFKNDTNSYILIETNADVPNLTLTFNFYGTKSNREVKLVGPEVTNIKPHAADVYQDDPTLPKGTIKQVDFGVDGEDVTIYREIYVNGQMIKRDKFFSRYAPWTAVYLRGTR